MTTWNRHKCLLILTMMKSLLLWCRMTGRAVTPPPLISLPRQCSTISLVALSSLNKLQLLRVASRPKNCPHSSKFPRPYSYQTIQSFLALEFIDVTKKKDGSIISGSKILEKISEHVICPSKSNFIFIIWHISRWQNQFF